jgi:hypothetical protein
MIKTEYILRNEILLWCSCVRDRELLLTYMYTLNILNNYFMAILATDAVSFAFKLSPTGDHPHLQEH